MDSTTILGIMTTIAVTVIGGYFWWSNNNNNNNSASSKKSKPKLLVNDTVKYAVVLESREELSHDTRRFRFKLPSQHHVLGLPIGQHVYLSCLINGQLIIRPYTPVTSDEDTEGYFDLVIKVYFKNEKFPEGGKMSQFLNDMSIGSSIDVRGPSGNLIYDGQGVIKIRKNKTSPFVGKTYKNIGMIAGGTGITPMLQLIEAVLREGSNNEDEPPVKLWLLFANQSESDILLRSRLEYLQASHPNQLKIWFTVDRSSNASWQYSVGFVNSDMIRDRLPPPNASDTIVLLCGPPPMINFACLPNLDKLGHANRFAY